MRHRRIALYGPTLALNRPEQAQNVKRIRVINSAQIRAARALLALSQAQLSKLATVSATTIKRLEGASEIRGSAEVLWKIQTALEKAGVEFIPGDDSKGSGVRLKRTGEGASKGKSKRQKR
jgi:transcriptional regulator with XRE-family HTH domain